MIRRWPTLVVTAALAALGLASLRVWGRRKRQHEPKARELAAEQVKVLAQAGPWEWDIESGRTRWSDEARHLLEIDRNHSDFKEALRESALPQDWPRIRGALEKYLGGDTSAELEYRVVVSDGTEHWVSIRAVLERFPDGRARRLVGTVRDITERKGVEERLLRRLTLEGVVAGISTQFASVSMDSLDNAIQDALATFGTFADVDRTYVIMLSADDTSLSYTHEWCAPGVEPRIQDLHDVPAEGFSRALERLRRGQALYVPDTAALPPEAAVLRGGLESGQIRSVVNVPVYWRQRLRGILGFDAGRQSKISGEQDVTLLQTVGQVFASGFERREMEGEQLRAIAALATEREHLERRVNERTAELLKANERLFEQIKDREDVAGQLLRRMEENRRLTQKLIALQEQNRRVMAQELHDEMGQSLTAIKTDAVLIRRQCDDRQPQMRQSAENIIQIAEQVYDRIHELLRRLRPIVLDDVGLVAALKALVASSQLEALGMQCEQCYQGELDSVGERLKITLYRLVQEALTNIVKHAQARHVWIELTRETNGRVEETLSEEADIIRLSVRDDGRGADFSVRSFGYGLLGLRERVEALGGTFEVESIPGRGTVARAIVPVHAMLVRDE